FQVNLSGAVNATINDGQGIGTIINDDLPPGFSINDVSTIEGNSGTKDLVFTVSLAGATEVEARVNFATVDGSAQAGSDYLASAGTVVFAPGETSKPVPIQVLGDTTFEADEVFYVQLSDAVRGTVVRSPGKGTILNDDVLPTVSIADVKVNEGNS